jgi:hypothetical protein
MKDKVVLLISLLFCFPAFTAESYRPLFVIERSTNANVIHYAAKVNDDGRLDSREPVVAYWIMAAEDGRRQPLNALERVRAYGFGLEKDKSGSFYRMTLVSQRKLEIDVYSDGSYVRAETIIGGHRAYLSKIYVNARNSWHLRLVNYYELFGIDKATGGNCYERVFPD